MNGANLVGYIRCKWGSGQKISTAAKSFLSAQFIKSVSMHFVLKCRVYNYLRIMHLPEKFYKNPNVHKFNILMSTHCCDIIQPLAKYIHYALQRRSTILNQDS